MNSWRDLVTKPAFPIATLLAFGLVACATATPPQPANNAVAAAAPSAQPTAQSAAKAVSKKAAHKRLASHRRMAKHAQELATSVKPAPAVASDHQAPKRPAEAKLSAGNTASVLSRLHQDDLAEIAIAKVAEEKTASPEVRSYADQLISDHLAVDQTVVAMAQKTGVQLREPPAAAPAKAGVKNLETRLTPASGKNFDKTFLLQTCSDHERLLSKLKRDREDASNDEVEALIDKVMPIFQQDQQLARILISKEQAS